MVHATMGRGGSAGSEMSGACDVSSDGAMHAMAFSSNVCFPDDGAGQLVGCGDMTVATARTTLVR